MYAYTETELLFPYLQSFSQQDAQLSSEEFAYSQPNPSVGLPSGFLETSSIISDYNLGGEGDLFKAAEPVIGEEEAPIGLYPMTAAISMISDIESSLENGLILSDVFYECRKDLLAKEGNETLLSDVLTTKIPTDEIYVADKKQVAGAPFEESVGTSYGLRPMNSMVETQLKPNFLDFPVLDFGAIYGMQRTFDDGNIKGRSQDKCSWGAMMNKKLGNGDITVIQSPLGPFNVARSCSSEDRREKLSRYRSKKSKRNFDRKIKYACRKVLADSQPRIRGRFAKTEEIEESYKKR